MNIKAECDQLTEQLAAAQSEVDRLNALDPAVIAYDTRSVRALTNLIKERDDLREQLAAAQSERDQQQEWAMKFQRERDACGLRAGEYEKALEHIASHGYAGIAHADAKVSLAKEVLAKHRRGGESE